MATRKTRLTCACCGDIAGMFQQYPNQDKGYGICTRCVQWQLDRGETREAINFRFGTEGINFGKLTHSSL